MAARKELILPGMPIDKKGLKPGSNVYVEGDKIYSPLIGLLDIKNNVVNVIPLKGTYIPRVGDRVVGIITGYSLYSWSVDIRSPYEAILMAAAAFKKPLSKPTVSLSKFLDIGDVIVAKVKSFDLLSNPTLSINEKGYGKVEKGTLVEITPVKVPRLIGKRGSLINLIKKKLNVDMIIGQNGRIIVVGKDREAELRAAQIIHKVEREAHVPGLTDRISKMLEEW